MERQHFSDGMVLQKKRFNGRIGFAAIVDYQLIPESAKLSLQRTQKRRKREPEVGILKNEIEVFRESFQPVENPQAGAALKRGVFEEISPSQRGQCDLLGDFLGGVRLFLKSF